MLISITDNEKKIIRKVQSYTDKRSLTFVLPKKFTKELSIDKGDYLSAFLMDNKIVLQKLELDTLKK